MTDPSAFTDVWDLPDGGISIPELKWRELVFIGALRSESGGFVRDPLRPLPPFERERLFPEGVVFDVERRDGRAMLRPRAL